MEPTAAPAQKPKASPAELDQDTGKVQRGKGPVGSLENPEVYENGPGHVIPILEREFEDFDAEADKFLDGQTPEDKFIGFRLKQGVYGQRQPDVQMIRVKLPMGGVTPEQMDAFGSVVEKYAPLNKGHITTRQNIQIHHVPRAPYAGVTADELFDVTPYAAAYVRYFVRHPVTQLMPRKVKTAFTATDEDVAITGIHDIGFIPRERDGVRGVEGAAERPYTSGGLRLAHGGGAPAPAPPAATASPNGDRSEFDRFLESNVRAQRQAGFSAITVKVTRGDLTPEQLRGLGQIMREYTGGSARTTVQQNLVLRWVRDGGVYDVWQRLGELGLADAGASEIDDIVSCPGTDSCKLGITSSMGLNR